MIYRIKTIFRAIYEKLFPIYTKRRKFIYTTKGKIMVYFDEYNKYDAAFSIKHSVPKKLNMEFINFKVYEKPIVSIIIPVYNQINYTYNCLKSIYENTNKIPYEVIIADDCSTDETTILKNYIKGVKIIRNKENLKFLRSCNNAAKYAKGKYILFLNNDTKVMKNWLYWLVKLIESDKKIGMVGSKLLFQNMRIQEAGGIIWNDASGWNYGRGGKHYKPEYNYVKEVDYISGASIMIRKSLWKKIGGFDDRFAPAYCEDSDLAFEVRKLGYKVVYQPKSVVIHYEGISNGKNTSSGLKQYQIVNNKKFYEKWKNELQNQKQSGQDVFLARDRSFNKKTILFIDHYVPHFDQDAGSKTVFSYIKIFLNMNYNVKFIPDNYIDEQPYTTILQQMGVEVIYGMWYSLHYKQWIMENGKYIDIVFTNRPHISIKYIDILKQYTKSKIIYYGHDLHYLREFREYKITQDKEQLKIAKDMKNLEYSIMKKADIVYYPSQIEVNIIKKLDSKINAKVLQAYVYDKFQQEDIIDIDKRKDLMFVGGFAHKPNIDAVLWFVNSIFPIVLKSLPNIKFYIIGSNPTKEIQNLASENIIIKGFISDEELEKVYKNVRIDVIPLRYGAGIKGKVVEGIYNNIPIVTTSVGIEGLVNCKDILIVKDNEKEFANAIISLYNNFDKLNFMVKNMSNYIKENFSLNNAINIIKNDILKE